MFKFGSVSKLCLATVDERLRNLSNEVLAKSNVDFGITSGLRTAENQHSLFLQGLTPNDGYKKISKHQSGEAIDFFAFVDNKVNYDWQYMKYIGDLFIETGKEYGLIVTWGGYYKPIDIVHIQICN